MMYRRCIIQPSEEHGWWFSEQVGAGDPPARWEVVEGSPTWMPLLAFAKFAASEWLKQYLHQDCTCIVVMHATTCPRKLPRRSAHMVQAALSIAPKEAPHNDDNQ